MVSTGTLKDCWEGFREAVLGNVPDGDELNTIRKIFYTGAASLWSVFGDLSAEPDPIKKIERADDLRRELDVFRVEVAVEHAINRVRGDGDPS